MPRGAGRDQALGSLISGTARSGEIDADLLPSFSDETAMQRSLTSAIVQLGQVDEARARQLIDEHFDDAALRAQAVASLERTLAMRAQLPR
jgi:hypothetical protein